MSDYTRQNDFSAKDALPSGNPLKLIKGSEVDADFDAARTAINSKMDKTTANTVTANHEFSGNVTFSGTVALTGTETGFDSVHLGGIVMFAGAASAVDTPDWQFLEGAKTLGAVGSGADFENASYGPAFDIIKTAPWTDAAGLNPNTGTETFGVNVINLPDLGGRVAVGKQDSGQTQRLDGTNSAPDDRTLADADGEQEHVLTEAELDAHTHSIPTTTSRNVSGTPSDTSVLDSFSGSAGTTGSTGSGTAHNNTQPSIVIGWIIRLI